MRVAEDQARWRAVGQAYVQQWTVVDGDDDLNIVDSCHSHHAIAYRVYSVQTDTGTQML
jgi:hypothetical protein